MLDLTEVLTDIVSARAAADCAELYAAAGTEPCALVVRAARLALTAIARSDALYHNLEHTAHVTLTGLEILKARQRTAADVSPAIWANTVIALLCHDIGFVRTLCRADSAPAAGGAADAHGMGDIAGSSDAVLMPVHVNRGKRFVEETFLAAPLADIGFINACIERTRFPVPEGAWYARTDDFPGLVRAADLIGQLSDPRYLYKLPAIFFEFEETGFNAVTGYTRPGDLLLGYPAFFARNVAPYIDAARRLLEHSAEGRDILAHLYDNLERASAAAGAPLASAANS